ncbi:hypothetical protein GQR58_002016 [Nymphon striatum]|nr:hypothetical protein GQR58_002016 [Nymphon striatum]
MALYKKILPMNVEACPTHSMKTVILHNSSGNSGSFMSSVLSTSSDSSEISLEISESSTSGEPSIRSFEKIVSSSNGNKLEMADVVVLDRKVLALSVYTSLGMPYLLENLMKASMKSSDDIVDTTSKCTPLLLYLKFCFLFLMYHHLYCINNLGLYKLNLCFFPSHPNIPLTIISSDLIVGKDLLNLFLILSSFTSLNIFLKYIVKWRFFLANKVVDTNLLLGKYKLHLKLNPCVGCLKSSNLGKVLPHLLVSSRRKYLGNLALIILLMRILRRKRHPDGCQKKYLFLTREV